MSSTKDSAVLSKPHIHPSSTRHTSSSENPSRPQPKIALVCDWLTNVGGAEQVLLSIHRLFPDAPIYTSQYNPKSIDWFKDADVRTGWLQIFPAKLRRILSPLRQRYFSHLDLSDYDIIISVTGAEAKSVKFRPDATHFCYCHVPTQYYWQMYDDYVKNPGFGPLNFLVRPFFKLLVGKLRRADYAAAQLPTQFITISQYAATQIKKYYHRDSVIIPPPVAVENFAENVQKSPKTVENPVENSQPSKTEQKVSPKPEQTTSPRAEQKTSSKPEQPSSSLPKHYFLNFSRQVSWKRLDLAIRACQETGNHLVLVGGGPEHASLVKLANSAPTAASPSIPTIPTPNSPNVPATPTTHLPPASQISSDGLVIFLPATDPTHLKTYLEHADAFIFPSLEPFGIAPVEALAAGVPVIAYGDGGAKDYVKDGKNGLTFPRQTVSSLVEAIQKFQQLPARTFSRTKISQSATYYSEQRFQTELKELIHAQKKD